MNPPDGKKVERADPIAEEGPPVVEVRHFTPEVVIRV